MIRIAIFVVFLLNAPSFAASTEEYPEDYKSIDCGATIWNDAIAEYCQAKGEVYRMDIGTRYVRHSFEEISQALDPELEANYDMILMTNSAEGWTPDHAFIPNQHMLVVQKEAGQDKMFTRDNRGVITGLAEGVKTLKQIVGPAAYKEVRKRGKHGYPINWNGIDMVPVSTGSRAHLLSFSGIFQVNWGRSKSHQRSSYAASMSNQLYVGYYYHSRGTSRDNWTNGRRERVSYAAVHGTPAANWSLLGKSRASHGCTRVHPALQKAIKRATMSVPSKTIIELDWDYNLGERDPRTPTRSGKPVLLIVFDGYESMGV